MSIEKVILVDENDNQIGLMPKLEAHQKGVLHRAFSIFIFNSKYELLLQKELLRNTIPVGYGQILVVAILVKVKKY